MTTRPGYAALLSVIVISAVLVATSITLSLDAYEARSAARDAEAKAESRSLAEACARKALLDAVLGTGGPGLVTVDADASPPEICLIRSVTHAADGSLDIIVSGEFPQAGPRRAATDLEVTAQPPDFAVRSWRESPDRSARAPPSEGE